MLSILGADESDGISPPRALEDAYIDGITSIAGKTDAWILTNGFSCGASDLTGKAVASFGAGRERLVTTAVRMHRRHAAPRCQVRGQVPAAGSPLSTSAILKLCPRNLHQWKIFGTQRGPACARRARSGTRSAALDAHLRHVRATFEIVKARLEEHAYDDDDALSHIRPRLAHGAALQGEAAMLGEVTSPKELLVSLLASSYSRRRAGRPARRQHRQHVSSHCYGSWSASSLRRASSANPASELHEPRRQLPRAAPRTTTSTTPPATRSAHHTHFVLVDAPAATAAPTNSKSSDSKSSTRSRAPHGPSPG